MEPVEVGLVVPQGWSEVTYAKDQPKYIPLPTLKCVDGRAVSRWQPTPEERAKIAAGADVYLTIHTFNRPLQPVLLTVDGAPVEPLTREKIASYGPPVPPRPNHRPAGCIVAALGAALLLSWPAPAPAAEPTPTPAVTTEGLSGAGTIFTDSGEQIPMFWARVETRYRAGRLQLAVRVDGSSERGDVSLENPTTVQTLEGFALGSFRVLPAVAVAGAIGATRPVIGTPGPWRRTWVAGPLLGTRDRYVLLGVGEREPVAPGLLGMASFRWQMRERTGIFGDLAARQVRDCTPDGVCGPPRLGYQLRVSVAVTAFGGR